MAAGHHGAVGPAAFQAGLGHAFIAVAVLLALCAITVAILGKTSRMSPALSPKSS